MYAQWESARPPQYGPSLMAQRMTGESPSRQFAFYAACARRAKIAASARSTTLHGGRDRCHSIMVQRSCGEEFTGRGLCRQSASPWEWLLCVLCDGDVQSGAQRCPFTANANETVAQARKRPFKNKIRKLSTDLDQRHLPNGPLRFSLITRTASTP
jgi:hypothetical protein